MYLADLVKKHLNKCLTGETQKDLLILITILRLFKSINFDYEYYMRVVEFISLEIEILINVNDYGDNKYKIINPDYTLAAGICYNSKIIDQKRKQIIKSAILDLLSNEIDRRELVKRFKIEESLSVNLPNLPVYMGDWNLYVINLNNEIKKFLSVSV